MRDRLSPLTIPSRQGRVAVVTGASSGIGLATARALGQAGAEVVLAVRNLEKGSAVADKLRSEQPEGSYRVEQLDVADRASIDAFVERLNGGRVDILVNNAGRQAPRQRETNAEGHEATLATNYFGHFTLTGLLLPNLRRASRARVVCVSSLMAAKGRIDADDLNLERRWSAGRAYANSKLAMVMFARELQKRSASGDWGLNAHAAHPGWAATSFFDRNPPAKVGNAVGGLLGLCQSSADGAQPVVFCAASRQVVAGAYYGPIGSFHTAGPVGRMALPRQARNTFELNALWQATQELTGVHFGRD
jgi:NAD(P)-dependent dehydrogenase (short-subunit alcohol dehydrogenase family)